MAITTITSKGQITLPKSIRDKLHMEAGEKLDCRIDEASGTAILVPINKHIDEVFGILNCFAPGKPISIEDIDKSVAQRFKKKFQ